MAWQIELTGEARRQLRRLDTEPRTRILRYLRQKVATGLDPKRFGKPLRGRFRGLWRYRVADYRVVCRIEDERLVVLVIGLGHRKHIYDRL